ncbi:MAG: hypothetical protein WCY11_18245 [Novosphingobium sp.]
MMEHSLSSESSPDKGMRDAEREDLICAADISAPFHMDELSVRSRHLRDRNHGLRSQWARGVFPQFEDRQYHETDTRIFSRHDADFDLFLFHGDDPGRMSRFLKANRIAVSSKIALALLARRSATDTTMLLNAGYDDVFDVTMDAVEAIIRVRAIERRRNVIRLHPAKTAEPALSSDLSPYVVYRLSPRERDILLKLANACGRPVPTNHLCLPFNAEGPLLNKEAVSVFISRLRKKLRPRFTIRSGHNATYTLCES